MNRFFRSIFQENKKKLVYTFFFLSLFLLLSSCVEVYGNNVEYISRIKSYPAAHLVWSPSGRYIALRNHGGVNQSTIFILEVQTKDLIRLWEEKYGNKLPQAWSSDEAELYFSIDSSNEYKSGIWITDITGTEEPIYFTDGIRIAVSPSGRMAIARSDENRHIFISIEEKLNVEIDRKSFTDAIAISSLSWDTAGEKLVFAIDNGETRRMDIYIYDIEARSVTQLTSLNTNDEPSLSPNGKLIAYVKGDFSQHFPTYRLHIMNSDGTCDIEVPQINSINSPAWSPDGRKIAFVGIRNGIYLLDVVSTFGQDFVEKGLVCK